MSKVASDGSVELPAPIREKLNLTEGDEIAFEETDAGIVLRKRGALDPIEKWRGSTETDLSVEEQIAEIKGQQPETGSQS